jgi:hypothetical protein
MRHALLVLALAVCALAQYGVRPWFLGLDGGVYQGTSRVGVGTGTSLTVVGDRAYLVGNDQRIWTSGPEGNWRVADPVARATKVAAASDGAVFVLGTDNGVWQLGVGRIGLGTGLDLAVGEGHDLFVVGTDSRIWKCEEAKGSWKPYNGVALGKHVAASPNGTVAMIGLDGGVYFVDTRNVQRLGLATGQSLCLTTAGVPYIVGMDNAVYFYMDGGDWQRLGDGLVRQIAWPR